MAATITKIAGPSVVEGKGVEYSFSVLMDTSHATGGEAIDLTDYFSYFYGGTVDGMDAVADAVYKYDVIGPGRTTAVTSSNVLIAAHMSANTSEPMDPAGGEDLSGVGALIITCWGKAAIPSSWA